MGVIPCGSGNDLAAAAGIPATPEGALDVLLETEARPTDYLECSGVRGLNIIGAGIDADILRRSYRAKVLKGSSELLRLPHFEPSALSEFPLPRGDERRGDPA